MPTMGGQTALNCALDLNRMGVLDKYNVEMIGADADTIDKLNPAEFNRCVAAMAVMAYVIADLPETLPR